MRRGGRGGGGAYRNPCITMHQPWASLLVHGIKRVEGRSWPAPLTGRLWIHAAGKVPDPETIKTMEHFYRQIYAINGIHDIKFPEHYPVSRLVGCVEVVGCVKSEELTCWKDVPESVRLEGLTNFCWLCEQPQKLVVPFEMRGYQRVYNLERKIVEAAIRGLCRVKGPLPVKFPLPNPRDLYSLKPGSLTSSANSDASLLEKSAGILEAIAGARAAATQFSNKHQSRNTGLFHTSPQDSSLECKEILQNRNTSDVHTGFVENRLLVSNEIHRNRMTLLKSSLNPETIHDHEFERTAEDTERIGSAEDTGRTFGPLNVLAGSSNMTDELLNDGCWDNNHNKSTDKHFRAVGLHFRAPTKRQWRRLEE